MNRNVPSQYAGIYERAMTGKSRKAAIRAFCLECVGWQAAEVENCTDTGCPLFPYRSTCGKAQNGVLTGALEGG